MSDEPDEDVVVRAREILAAGPTDEQYADTYRSHVAAGMIRRGVAPEYVQRLLDMP